MIRYHAYKFVVSPDGRQERDMRYFAGSCRFVFNKALAIQEELHRNGQPRMGYAKMCNMLTLWRNSLDTAWLSHGPNPAQQHALKAVQKAYTNFFQGKAGFPRFKKKAERLTFFCPNSTKIKLDQNNSRIWLPKLGWMRYRNSRKVRGEVKSVNVEFRHRRWFVSVNVQEEVMPATHPSTSSAGIDLGVVRFATFNDGTFIPALNAERTNHRRLLRYQRRFARKVKFSKNWHKAKDKVNRIHADVFNSRKDFIHKLSASICKNHAMVAIEDLHVNGMAKSASGTISVPGKKVHAKSGLNRSIMDQGWYEFRRQLEYKMRWSGGVLIAVPAPNTSLSCPICQYVSKGNRLSQSDFDCRLCGYRENSDTVGAINILERGHRLLACGEVEYKVPFAKQEPVEVTNGHLAVGAVEFAYV